jgi:lycopene elongase/hydratase (dihydrobisanhydrobacterioruberin-forming)
VTVRPSQAAPRRRALGYRLLGARLDYFLHLRPAEWPIVAAHTAVGSLVALGSTDLGAGFIRPLQGIVLWVICLNGGTLAINSAFDRDVTDIAYLKSPPPPPRFLFPFGLGLMLLGLVLASALPPGYRAAYALCVGLSVLYSVPPFRLKAVAGMDWLINMWGFGTLTAYAGWAATGVPVTDAGRPLLLGFCPLFAALYPLTQLYQLEEDRARGDRTLAVVLGARSSLALAAGCAVIAFILFGLAGWRAGWPERPDAALRWTSLGLAAAGWAAVLVPWLRNAESLPARAHQRRMYWALAAWAVTDAAVLFGFAR